jgi:hypothetical protein
MLCRFKKRILKKPFCADVKFYFHWFYAKFRPQEKMLDENNSCDMARKMVDENNSCDTKNWLDRTPFLFITVFLVSEPLVL